MLYGLLTYLGHEDGVIDYNIGDYVQSLAARQYLPKVDVMINRERLAAYNGPPLKLIMNGWFTHHPDNWVPSPAIVPHFVSFHVNSNAADRMLSPKGVDYLKRHSPIGCRDHHTVGLLRSRGIDAYFTGCLTLTLDKYAATKPARAETLLVDPFSNILVMSVARASLKSLASAFLKGNYFSLRRHLSQGLDPSLLGSLTQLTHVFPSKRDTEENKLERAESILRRYSEAKLVITSRIHCALPCIAMKTPVVLLNQFDDLTDTCRFEGLFNLLNRIDYFPDKAPQANFDATCTWDGKNIPANPTHHTKLAADLRASCLEFIQTN